MCYRESMSRAHRHYDLDDVRRVYRVWGEHPSWYFAQDLFSFMGRHREIRSQTVAGMRLRPGDRVLEVGCGNGRNLGYLRDAVGPTGSVVGIDYTPQMLDHARRLVRRNGWNNVDLRLADAAEVSLPPESFDAALAVMSLSAMPEPQRAMERVRAALRPGAVFAVSDGRGFPGRLRVLNSLLEDVVAPFGTWHPWRNLPDAMHQAFGNVSVRQHNFGTFFVARSVKP